MPTSPDTLLRLMHRAPLPPSTAPRVLGVDDWAWRKGRTYGSILVDVEAHRVVDLLPDRSAPTLTSWLRSHPGVGVVTTAPSSEYARAAAQCTPRPTSRGPLAPAAQWAANGGTLVGRGACASACTAARRRCARLRRAPSRQLPAHT
ncbi:transposase [Melittangium boletus]